MSSSFNTVMHAFDMTMSQTLMRHHGSYHDGQSKVGVFVLGFAAIFQQLLVNAGKVRNPMNYYVSWES